ncbi:MAG: 2-hydroxyacid dehydrogenase [Stackebrandtia sp.]
MKVWIAHENGRDAIGELPDGVLVETFAGKGEYPSSPSDVEFWVPPFLGDLVSTRPIEDMAGLRVVQLLTAGAEVWTPVVPRGVALCNGKGVHSAATAEWAVTAAVASLRGFDVFARAQQRGEWAYPGPRDTLVGKRVLVVGAGAIGEAIARRVVAFDAEPIMVARRARPGVSSVDELPKLLPQADVVVLIVPLTDATRGMVDAKFLARMSDGALLVNAARGPVVDTDALLTEARSGRISAALDVTDPEPLPPENELWSLPNVLITPHVGGSTYGLIERAYSLVGRQLRRYAKGEPLENVVVGDY